MSVICFFFFKQKTAYEMRISDWSSDVCSSDLSGRQQRACRERAQDKQEKRWLDGGQGGPECSRVGAPGDESQDSHGKTDRYACPNLGGREREPKDFPHAPDALNKAALIEPTPSLQ